MLGSFDFSLSFFKKICEQKSTCLAQLVEYTTPDLWVVRSRATLGVETT